MEAVVMERDLVQVLAEDHAVLRWLGERLSAATRTAKPMVFNEFARALGAHETVVEQTVLPALKATGWRGLSSDVLTGHADLRRELADLLTMDKGSAAFDVAVERLLRRLARQCDLEEEKLLPVLRASLDDTQRELLAFDAESHLTRLLGDDAPDANELELAQPVNELLEEAHVVLGSLPVGDEQETMSP
jgi:hypothetical protein